jgi:hypothetical protein
MSLVEHARRELELCGQTASDPAYAQSIVCAVAALATYGHSGGSMGCAIMQLHDLLQYRPLSPLTNDPDEWVCHAESRPGVPGTWQNLRDSAAFSTDGGATYRYVDDRAATGRHMAVEHGPKDGRPAVVDECSPPPLAAVKCVCRPDCTPGSHPIEVLADDPYPPLTHVDDGPEEADR